MCYARMLHWLSRKCKHFRFTALYFLFLVSDTQHFCGVHLYSVPLSTRSQIGTPFKMVPVAEDAHLFHALSASNQRPMAMIDEAEEEARSARQLVDTTFRFTAHDLKGNRAGGIK